MTLNAKQYKIKKRYGLKGLPDGWFIYSRYIVPAKAGSSYKRRRISGPYASRKEAVRAAKKMMRKSNKLIKKMTGKKHEVSK